jgi:hypothetical protein
MLVLEINKAWGTFKICDLDEKGNGTILGNGIMASGNSATEREKDEFINAIKNIANIKVQGI